MSKVPGAMRRDGRHPDPHFHSDEFLFRRIPTRLWDDSSSDLEVDAVELPDMSVGRSKYGHPEWARFDVQNGRFYEDWGVVGVQMKNVPPERWQYGVFRFSFRVFHDPLEMDYPHSEVRVFEGEEHIDIRERIPEDVHLKWREQLLRETKPIIKPFQRVKIREDAPVSHKLEPVVLA